MGITATPKPRDEEVSEGYPNPSQGQPLSFEIAIAGNSRVDWAVYTTAFRKIRAGISEGNGPRRIVWDLRDTVGKPVASGLYYVTFTSPEIGGRNVVRKVMVLR